MLVKFINKHYYVIEDYRMQILQNINEDTNFEQLYNINEEHTY